MTSTKVLSLGWKGHQRGRTGRTGGQLFSNRQDEKRFGAECGQQPGVGFIFTKEELVPLCPSGSWSLREEQRREGEGG